MADPSDVQPHRRTSYSARAAERLREQGLSPRRAHVINAVATTLTLFGAGLDVMERPLPTLAVIAVTTVGSTVVGSAHERYGERRGREAGRQEGLAEGRAAAVREARQERSSGRGSQLSRTRPGNRDRGGR